MMINQLRIDKEKYSNQERFSKNVDDNYLTTHLNKISKFENDNDFQRKNGNSSNNLQSTNQPVAFKNKTINTNLMDLSTESFNNYMTFSKNSELNSKKQSQINKKEDNSSIMNIKINHLPIKVSFTTFLFFFKFIIFEYHSSTNLIDQSKRKSS